MDNLTAGNPVAHRVRVYYTGDDTLYEGEPLCYSFKTTKNWFGGSVSDAGVVSATTTTAEGSHNESKYMCVESPMRISLSSDTPASGSKVITGTTTDFDALHKGMFVSISGTHVTNGNYEITAISRSTETAITNSTITLGGMADATGATADVATAIDNIPAFAGVVAKGGWCGKTGPMVLDIYVPNGAVVPVRNDQNCVLGRTILAVHTNEQHLTAPHATYALPVAIAWETVDTATTTGLCLAKLDTHIFINQDGDNLGLLVDDEDSSDMVINSINVVSSVAATKGFTAFKIRSEIAAASGYPGIGVGLHSDVVISATCADCGILPGNFMSLTTTAGTPPGGVQLYGLQVDFVDTGATLTSTGRVAPLYLRSQVTGNPDEHYMIVFVSDGTGDHPNGLFACNEAADIALNATHTAVTTNGSICFHIGTIGNEVAWYIPCGTTPT